VENSCSNSTLNKKEKRAGTMTPSEVSNLAGVRNNAKRNTITTFFFFDPKKVLTL